jgi:peptidoglycan hydrolase-like protein with peptidoglycan-binding domain
VRRRDVVGVSVLLVVFLGVGNGAYSKDAAPPEPSDVAVSSPDDAATPSVEPAADSAPLSEHEPEKTRRPTLLGLGDAGPRVRELQARLKQIYWYFDLVTGVYDEKTEKAVRGFQRKRGFARTGDVDRRTWKRLLEMTWEPSADELHNRIPVEMPPGPLDPRCLTGRVLCIDKSTYSLRWVVDGDVRTTFDVRFGSELTPTREGEFEVSYMSRYHVSTLYDTSMPFAMFFSGGQAVHYSPDFAAVGYAGASHGCVNVRDYDGIAKLFDQVRLGDSVVVYWS